MFSRKNSIKASKLNEQDHSLKRTISLPIRKNLETDPIDNKQEDKDFIVYKVKYDYIPEIMGGKNNENGKFRYFEVSKGEIVQLISHESNKLCFVRSISSIGSGLVPFSFLEKNIKIDKSVNYPPILTKLNPLLDLTPPTSPSTIISKSFSIASVSRSSTLKNSEVWNNKSTTCLSSIESCEVINIENEDNRLQYTLKVMDSGKKEHISKRFYKNFYNLQSKLFTKANSQIKLPRLPIPFSCTNDMAADYLPTEKRLQIFNKYLTEMFDAVKQCSCPILRQLLYIWLMENTTEFHELRRISVKVNYDGQGYEINCDGNDIDSLVSLKSLISKNISQLPKSNYKLKANIGGWYIVELSSEKIYCQVFVKTWQSQTLTLDVI